MSDAKVRTEISYNIRDDEENLYTVEILDEGQRFEVFIDKNGGESWMSIPTHVWPAISKAAEKVIAGHKTSPGNGGKNE